MPVVAYINTYIATGRLKDWITQITRLKEKLFPKPFYLWDVVLAILAKISSVGVYHCRCIVINSSHVLFVYWNHHNHAVFFCILLHKFSGWPIGNALRKVIPLWILRWAKVWAGEDFLHAKHLHAILPRLIN